MEKNIYIDFELFILDENLTTENIQKDKEITVENAKLIATLNRVPAYKNKLKTEEGLILSQIIKILNEHESQKIKEKFFL
ncbi:hypothetical protein [Persephonella sp.]